MGATSYERPDARRVLAGLKDFQRDTVDYVFERLYGIENRKSFLVADEVGLGKTLVARGIIAKTLEHLWEKRSRIDIIYICSNAEIARQNVNRLNVTGQREIALATRMTLLPARMRDYSTRKINFISFTPDTSFNLGSRTGLMFERALLFHLLGKLPSLKPPKGISELLRGDVGTASWKASLFDAKYDADAVDLVLIKRFDRLIKKAKLYDRLEASAKLFTGGQRKLSDEQRRDARQVIGELREILALASVGVLKPDLIILDEFQRFKSLLDGDDEAATLAKALFQAKNAKTLLLSATPYKMYTMGHELGEDEHYSDFLRTVDFLLGSDHETVLFRDELARYQKAIYSSEPQAMVALSQAKEAVESRLRKVMTRTERLAVTDKRDGMLDERHVPTDLLKPQDLHGFRVIDRIACELESRDTVEYWKSAPYILNTMDQTYKVKTGFVEKLSRGELEEESLDALRRAKSFLLQWKTVRKYDVVDPGNAKLRFLLQNTVEKGAWKLLWIPPSLPYYKAAVGPYADPTLKSFTKALVFSAWQVAPKAIAMLTSYEAERRAVRAALQTYDPKPNHYDEERRKRAALLTFGRQDGRNTGMSAFTLLYPCLTLAQGVDPLTLAIELSKNGQPPSLDAVRKKAEAQVRKLLRPIRQDYRAKRSGTNDERWYWAALALLDAKYHRTDAKHWRRQDFLSPYRWENMGRAHYDEDTRFGDHAKFFWDVFDGGEELGVPPADLEAVLARIALASPAITALRALRRLNPQAPTGTGTYSSALMGGAAKIAHGFRNLFNLPDSITLVRSLRHGQEEAYWEAVLDYCLQGNLQASLDEYAHVLKESLGAVNRKPEEAARLVADEIMTAVSLRTTSLKFDDFVFTKGEHSPKIHLQSKSIRCRFALRYGDDKDEESGEETRAGQVRAAFNSPFRPFVLATTSVGQEGLDFHPYCHSVYHWNLPANPVDLEQREGRVHRYKGHVIRRNVALKYGLAGMGKYDDAGHDPWELLFARARADHLDKSELVPYWIFEVPEGGHKIERYVPAVPLSREKRQLENLKQMVTIYRMVFGQPRQDDLVEYFLKRFGREPDLAELERYRIDLSVKSDRAEPVLA